VRWVIVLFVDPATRQTAARAKLDSMVKWILEISRQYWCGLMEWRDLLSLAALRAALNLEIQLWGVSKLKGLVLAGIR